MQESPTASEDLRVLGDDIRLTVAAAGPEVAVDAVDEEKPQEPSQEEAEKQAE